MTTINKEESSMADNRPTITLGDFRQALQDRTGATFITIIAETEPKMNKRGNPYLGRVTKRARVNGSIGGYYPDMVNHQRAREGLEVDFKAVPRLWGVRIVGTPFVEHRGNLYLEMKVERVLSSEYLLDGEPVDRAILDPWLPVRKKSESSRQGVDKDVVIRDYMLTRIREAVFDNTRFRIS